jgi:hypothetical protein
MSLRATQEELKSFNVVAEGKPLPLKKKIKLLLLLLLLLFAMKKMTTMVSSFSFLYLLLSPFFSTKRKMKTPCFVVIFFFSVGL